MINDMISRAAAIECAIDAVENWDGGCNPNREEYIRKYFEELPSVDAAPVVRAEWIEEPDRVNHYHCSNCGVVWGVSAMAMKYCPNCTAKMTNSPLWDMEDEAAIEMAQYCERYEPTFNPEDGSM